MQNNRYVYITSEPRVFTVGFYDPEGTFQPESDHASRDAAASRVNYLHGGGQGMRASELKVFRDLASYLKDTLELEGGCDHSVGLCSCWEQHLLEEANSVLVNYAGFVIKEGCDGKKGL